MDRDQEWFARQRLLGILALPETYTRVASVWEQEEPERTEELIREGCLERRALPGSVALGVPRARVTEDGRAKYQLDLWDQWRRESLNSEVNGLNIEPMTEEQLAKLEAEARRGR